MSHTPTQLHLNQLAPHQSYIMMKRQSVPSRRTPVQPETNQMEVTTTQHSQSEHVPLRRSTRISKRPTFCPH